ncbi:c-type cytochrome [Actibacterium ureilyticum]|uniref:c-type cytochrome n=1 Tax=Actibacterium ureilyticum TaxID=1590614 RepID=UPI000BAAF319|nr:cytochrome c [Actibacterium ureilyticum]
MRTAIFATLALALPAIASADPMEDTIAARQGFYKLLGANVGIIAAMAKGETDYDAAGAQTAADNIVTLTNYNLAHVYVPGTSADEYPGKTRALGKIWEEFPAVAEKGAGLKAAALEMQAAAGQGQGEMAAALGKLGGACKACHDDYRAK